MRRLRNVVLCTILFANALHADSPCIPDMQVLAVRPESGLVMLSAGSQQGIKAGEEIIVFRRDQFVAKVRVDRIYPDMCSAKVIPGLLKREIQVHDEACFPVHTELNFSATKSDARK